MSSEQAANGTTVRDLLAASAQQLTLAAGGARFNPQDAAPALEARREAELLLGQALGRDRAWLYAHPEERIAVAASTRFQEMLARRLAGTPLAYILGRREFWSLDLTVTPDVLIPRAETELLVELALRHIPQERHVEIVDLGTGSGAIALAIARERPQASVLAIDISAAALALALSNAQRLGIVNVEFALGDWFANTGARRFDLVVSNPPYIAQSDSHLAQGDLRFEPLSALASGGDGLDAIRAIVSGTRARLKPGGWLLFEHGYQQGDAVRALLQGARLENVLTERDLEGRERVSGGMLPH